MKSRLTLIFAALTVLLGAMVWLVHDRPGDAGATATGVGPTDAVRAAPATALVAPGTTPGSAAVAPVATPALQSKSSPMPAPMPMASRDAAGGVRYVARTGDTVSQLASAMLGSDSKVNRDAVISGSVALQSKPDRVLAGQTYSVPAPSARAAGDVADARPDPAPVVAPAAATSVEATPREGLTAEGAAGPTGGTAGGPNLTYTAQPGDTVRGLAAHLLGGDTKANREAITAGNSSLRRDPDRLVAGQSYTIVARNGLAADPDAPRPRAPTTQPEADEVAQLSVGRMLGYEAQPGDTVSKLAVILLGSDTRANRELIIRSNFNLKLDPDHLVAGVTYWIPAPTADPKE